MFWITLITIGLLNWLDVLSDTTSLLIIGIIGGYTILKDVESKYNDLIERIEKLERPISEDDDIFSDY